MKYLVACIQHGVLPGTGGMREQDPDEIEALEIVEAEREKWLAELRKARGR